jgi:hypothetical protein
VLAEDAREGTRVSAVHVNGGKNVAVGYIAGRGEELVARLWVDDGRKLLLSPEGSQGTSVSLLPNDRELLALTLEGRTSMSPVHARRVNLRGKHAMLSEDSVVWVGPPSNSLTEMVSLGTKAGGAWVLIAMERTVTAFGLAHFQVLIDSEQKSKVNWLAYENGIDPAPVATVKACGLSLVIHALPSDARPRSPQELRVAKLESGRLVNMGIVARSRAFNNVSAAKTPQGFLLAWTADRRTWARPVTCTRK